MPKIKLKTKISLSIDEGNKQKTAQAIAVLDTETKEVDLVLESYGVKMSRVMSITVFFARYATELDPEDIKLLKPYVL